MFVAFKLCPHMASTTKSMISFHKPPRKFKPQFFRSDVAESIEYWIVCSLAPWGNCSLPSLCGANAMFLLPSARANRVLGRVLSCFMENLFVSLKAAAFPC
jgi:hypothetical protein